MMFIGFVVHQGVAAVLAVTRDCPRVNQAFIVEISYVAPHIV